MANRSAVPSLRELAIETADIQCDELKHLAVMHQSLAVEYQQYADRLRKIVKQCERANPNGMAVQV